MLRNLADDPPALVVALGLLLALLALTATTVLVVAAALAAAAPGATLVTRARLREQLSGLGARAAALVAVVGVLGFTSDRWQPAAFLVGAAVNAGARAVPTVAATLARRGRWQRGQAVPHRSRRLLALPLVAYVMLTVVTTACSAASVETRHSLPELAVAAAVAAVLTEAGTQVALRRPAAAGLSPVEDRRLRHSVAVRMAQIEALAVVVTAVAVLAVTGGALPLVASGLLLVSLPLWTLVPLGRP